MSKDLISQGLDILNQVAPTIASMIGGPFAGQAVTAIQKALGIEPGTSKDGTLAALAVATPEQLLELKKEDNRHEEALEQLDITRDQLDATDRDSARKREVDSHDVWTPRVLASIIVLGWMAIQAFLFTHIVAAEMRDIIMRVLGTLDASLTMVLAYYFGSNAGSRVKDATLSKLQDALTKLQGSKT